MSMLFGYNETDRICVLNGDFSMQGDINMLGNKVINLPDPTSDTEPVTKSYADTHYSGGGGSRQQGPQGPKGDKGDTGPQGPAGTGGSTGGLSDTGFTMTGDIDMGGNKITNLPTPAFDHEPATKQYTDEKFSSNAGFAMAGNIHMNNNRITDLPDPTSNSEPVTKSYADTHYSGSGQQGAQGSKGDKGDTCPQGPAGSSSTGWLSDTGFTMQGNIDMSTNRILGLPDPILNKEPVTKKYADYNYLPRHTDLNIGLNKIESYADTDSDIGLINRRYADSRYVQKTKLPVAEWISGYFNLDSSFKYPDAFGGVGWPSSVRTDEITAYTTIKLTHLSFDNELTPTQILASTITVKIKAYSPSTSYEHQLLVSPMTGRTIITSPNSTSSVDLNTHTVILDDSYFIGPQLCSNNIRAYTIRMKLTGTFLAKPEVIACFKLYEIG